MLRVQSGVVQYNFHFRGRDERLVNRQPVMVLRYAAQLLRQAPIERKISK